MGRSRWPAAIPSEELTAARIQPEMKGAVVIGGGRMEGEAIRKAVAVGVSALVSGGIDDQDLKETLGYDLGVAVTGSEKIGLTLIVTEGFGDIAMAERTFRLLASRAGIVRRRQRRNADSRRRDASGNRHPHRERGQRGLDRRNADRHAAGTRVRRCGSFAIRTSAESAKWPLFLTNCGCSIRDRRPACSRWRSIPKSGSSSRGRTSN